jgi:putative ABC transport system ATP-binding protein
MIGLEIVSLGFSKGTPQEHTVFQDVSLVLQPGELTMLLGPNGSGKSSLLGLLAGTVMPNNGKVIVNGAEVTPLPAHARAPWVARVFQDPKAGTAADLSILHNFRLASLRNAGKAMKWGSDEAFRYRVAQQVVKLGMGLETQLNRPMSSLSGGQRQALTLLMAGMAPCTLLLLDEPTAALDPRSAELVLELTRQLVKEHQAAALLITHQMKDALQHGERVLVLGQGKIAGDFKDAERKALSAERLLEFF